MLKTPRNHFVTLLTILLLLFLTAPAHAGSVTASEVSIIQPGGPRTTGSGTTLVDFFFNAEGSNNGTFASFAVADFSGLHAGITSLSQLKQFQLQLTEDNAGFTTAGKIGVYLSTDTTTNIGLGSALKFQSSSLPQGLGTQLNGAVNNLLGTFSFPTTGSGSSGQIDTIDLTSGLSSLSSSAQTTLLNALNNKGAIRLVVAPEDPNVSATYAGINNFSFPHGAPVLSAAAAPEPSSLLLLALGLTSLPFLSRCNRIRNSMGQTK
jgi:hypothetical protein